MSIYTIFRDGIGDGIEEVGETIVDVYQRDFGWGPVTVSIEDIADKAYKHCIPPDSYIEDDEAIGAETVTILASSNAAFDQENFVGMFQRQNNSPYDGAIITGTRRNRVFAPFSTYTPTALWPYQADDGSRFTVHNLAKKDIGLPDWSVKPLSVLLQQDLDIDQDGKPAYGGLPLLNLAADPLMGLGPLALGAILIFAAAQIIPVVTPLLITP